MTEGTSATALVVGESLIDIVEDGAGVHEFVGGSPANVAIGLARLEHPVDFLTRVGDDPRGRRIQAHLAQESVSLHTAPEGGFETSVSRAQIRQDGSADYSFIIDWRLPEQIDTASFSLVHVGSLGLFLEPGGSQLVRLLKSIAPSTIVTLDPNIRPSLVQHTPEALTRFVTAAELSHIVKLSDEDIAWLYPDLSVEVAARKILCLGTTPAPLTRAVFVTLGAEGALGFTRDRICRVAAKPATVIDTISAGDSFMASIISDVLDLGLAASLDSIETMLDHATAAAAFAVSGAGANPPRKHELNLVG